MSKNFLGLLALLLTFIILMGCPLPISNGDNTHTPTPTTSSTITPTPTTSSTITPTPTISSTITPTPTISSTITPTPTISSTITPTPTISSTITPTPTLSPKMIFDAFEKVRLSVISKAKKTADLNPDLEVDVFKINDSFGGTFELQEIYDFANQKTTNKYIFTNYNDSGTVYNCPSGQEITFVSSTSSTPPANPWQGRVDMSGNMSGYIIYHNSYADVNGTQVAF